MTASSVPGVSILIPTWNDAADLAACLDWLKLLDYPRGRIEIVIWDNS
jgi:GT2 family glycosyltransferase